MPGFSLSFNSSKYERKARQLGWDLKNIPGIQCLIQHVLISRFTWFFVWVSFNTLTLSSASFNEIGWKMTVIEPLSWVPFFFGHSVSIYFVSLFLSSTLIQSVQKKKKTEPSLTVLQPSFFILYHWNLLYLFTRYWMTLTQNFRLIEGLMWIL